jgi:hypothetical protein
MESNGVSAALHVATRTWSGRRATRDRAAGRGLIPVHRTTAPLVEPRGRRSLAAGRIAEAPGVDAQDRRAMPIILRQPRPDMLCSRSGGWSEPASRMTPSAGSVGATRKRHSRHLPRAPAPDAAGETAISEARGRAATRRAGVRPRSHAARGEGGTRQHHGPRRRASSIAFRGGSRASAAPVPVDVKVTASLWPRDLRSAAAAQRSCGACRPSWRHRIMPVPYPRSGRKLSRARHDERAARHGHASGLTP